MATGQCPVTAVILRHDTRSSQIHMHMILYIRYCVAAIIGHFDEDEKEQRWGEKVSKMYNSHAAEVWRMHIFNMLLFSNCCKLHFDTVLAKYVNFKMQNIRPVWKYIRSWWQEAASLTKSTSGKTWVAKTVHLYLNEIISHAFIIYTKCTIWSRVCETKP